MKIIKYIFIIIATVTMITGCDKYLDLEPSQSISEGLALDSDENVKSVLLGVYGQFDGASLYGGNILRNGDLLGSDGELLWVGTYTGPREIANKDMVAGTSDVTTQWQNSYAVINSANNVLSAIDVVNSADQDRVEGEALFLRSLLYFDLVRFYAQQYVPGSNDNDYGVPLILTPTRSITDSYVGRNTIKEVYDQVILDLIRAASILPLDNDEYASSGAANALLARVYMQMGDYANARDRAHTVISSGEYSLQATYAEVFNNDNNSPEDIFATQITAQDPTSSMTIFFSIPDFGGRDGDIEILAGHLGLYNPADDRLDLFFSDAGSTYTGKWNNQYGVVNLFRLAEMYLIRAECNERLATTIGDTPLGDYNRVHQRAGLPAAPSVDVNDIIYERRLELACEGFMIHDIRRLQASFGTYQWNDPEIVFPIPAREIEANPAIANQQNPGY